MCDTRLCDTDTYDKVYGSRETGGQGKQNKLCFVFINFFF